MMSSFRYPAVLRPSSSFQNCIYKQSPVNTRKLHISVQEPQITKNKGTLLSSTSNVQVNQSTIVVLIRGAGVDKWPYSLVHNVFVSVPPPSVFFHIVAKARPGRVKNKPCLEFSNFNFDIIINFILQY